MGRFPLSIETESSLNMIQVQTRDDVVDLPGELLQGHASPMIRLTAVSSYSLKLAIRWIELYRRHPFPADHEVERVLAHPLCWERALPEAHVAFAEQLTVQDRAEMLVAGEKLSVTQVPLRSFLLSRFAYEWWTMTLEEIDAQIQMYDLHPFVQDIAKRIPVRWFQRHPDVSSVRLDRVVADPHRMSKAFVMQVSLSSMQWQDWSFVPEEWMLERWETEEWSDSDADRILPYLRCALINRYPRLFDCVRRALADDLPARESFEALYRLSPIDDLMLYHRTYFGSGRERQAEAMRLHVLNHARTDQYDFLPWMNEVLQGLGRNGIPDAESASILDLSVYIDMTDHIDELSEWVGQEGLFASFDYEWLSTLAKRILARFTDVSPEWMVDAVARKFKVKDTQQLAFTLLSESRSALLRVLVEWFGVPPDTLLGELPPPSVIRRDVGSWSAQELQVASEFFHLHQHRSIAAILVKTALQHHSLSRLKELRRCFSVEFRDAVLVALHSHINPNLSWEQLVSKINALCTWNEAEAALQMHLDKRIVQEELRKQFYDVLSRWRRCDCHWGKYFPNKPIDRRELPQ
jgi:hypothetical protein